MLGDGGALHPSRGLRGEAGCGGYEGSSAPRPGDGDRADLPGELDSVPGLSAGDEGGKTPDDGRMFGDEDPASIGLDGAATPPLATACRAAAALAASRLAAGESGSLIRSDMRAPGSAELLERGVRRPATRVAPLAPLGETAGESWPEIRRAIGPERSVRAVASDVAGSAGAAAAAVAAAGETAALHAVRFDARKEPKEPNAARTCVLACAAAAVACACKSAAAGPDEADWLVRAVVPSVEPLSDPASLDPFVGPALAALAAAAASALASCSRRMRARSLPSLLANFHAVAEPLVMAAPMASRVGASCSSRCRSCRPAVTRSPTSSSAETLPSHGC